MIDFNVLDDGAMEVVARGKLTKEDYEKVVPVAEKVIEEQGPIGLVLRVEGFTGWSPAALWEDLKFDVRHYEDVSRLAIVGRRDTQKWMAAFSRPFTAGDVRFFPQEELAAARQWVTTCEPGTRSG